jgi:hypothetical protein
MNDIISQLSTLKIARYQIILQSQTEAVLPALIGSTLRGAFGHALKAISCCVPHKNCDICFLSDACLYTTVFEPTSAKLKNLPRPFIFEPSIPPLTKEISENSTLKLRVAEKGKVSFELILLGEIIGKLPYFIYAFELMARHGLGFSRQSFSISEVLSVDVNNDKTSVYKPDSAKIIPHQTNNLSELIEKRLSEINLKDVLQIQLLTPLRIRRNGELLENINFTEFFKQCSLRLKLLSENYGKPIEYDYKNLLKHAENIEVRDDNLWRHNFVRRTNRQDANLDLDGMLGGIQFQGNFADFLPIITTSEFLHIGSASSLGLGKFTITANSE